MVYLEIEEVIRIHDEILAASGGLNGIRDMGGLESALVQPQMEMFGEELYPTLAESEKNFIQLLLNRRRTLSNSC